MEPSQIRSCMLMSYCWLESVLTELGKLLFPFSLDLPPQIQTLKYAGMETYCLISSVVDMTYINCVQICINISYIYILIIYVQVDIVRYSQFSERGWGLGCVGTIYWVKVYQGIQYVQHERDVRLAKCWLIDGKMWESQEALANTWPHDAERLSAGHLFHVRSCEPFPQLAGASNCQSLRWFQSIYWHVYHVWETMGWAF